MIWLRWISWSWSDTLVFDSKAFLHWDIFIGRVSPDFLTNFLMQLLRKGFSKSISQCLYHHIVVIITLINVWLANSFLVESGRNSEETKVILLSWTLWSYEITHSNESILVFVNLLTNSAEFSFKSFLVILIVNFNIVIAVRVGWIETNYSSSFNELVVYDVLQHFLSIIEQLLSLLTDCLIIKDLWICSIWILSSDLPCLEERIPINEWNEFIQVVIFEHLGTE